MAAALTGGDVRIYRCEPEHIGGIMNKLRQTGAEITVEQDHLRVKGGDIIRSVDLKTLPYPGFPTDMQAQFMVLMSIADGISVISETVFENRFIHVSELRRMGADIRVSGNTAMVKGMNQIGSLRIRERFRFGPE